MIGVRSAVSGRLISEATNPIGHLGAGVLRIGCGIISLSSTLPFPAVLVLVPPPLRKAGRKDKDKIRLQVSFCPCPCESGKDTREGHQVPIAHSLLLAVVLLTATTGWQANTSPDLLHPTDRIGEMVPQGLRRYPSSGSSVGRHHVSCTLDLIQVAVTESE